MTASLLPRWDRSRAGQGADFPGISFGTSEDKKRSKKRGVSAGFTSRAKDSFQRLRSACPSIPRTPSSCGRAAGCFPARSPCCARLRSVAPSCCFRPPCCCAQVPRASSPSEDVDGEEQQLEQVEPQSERVQSKRHEEQEQDLSSLRLADIEHHPGHGLEGSTESASDSAISCSTPGREGNVTPSKLSQGMGSCQSTRDGFDSDGSGGSIRTKGGHECRQSPAKEEPSEARATATPSKKRPLGSLRGGATGYSPGCKTELEELLIEASEVQRAEHPEETRLIRKREVKDAEAQTVEIATSSSSTMPVDVLVDEKSGETEAAKAATPEAAAPDQDAPPAKTPVVPGRPQSRPPPPPKRAPSRQSLGPAGRSMPDWKGPRPPAAWRPERIINWQPVRQASRFDGSVWQQVHEAAALGLPPLDEELMQTSFMRQGATSMRRTRSASQLPVARCLSQAQALSADLAHAQLQRLGITSVKQLEWVLGRGRHKSLQQQVPEEEEGLMLEVLETLLSLLKVAVAEEQALREAACNHQALAPSEAFLKELLEVAPALTLQGHVEMAVAMAQFQDRANRLQKDITMGIAASRSVLGSRALPILLQGVLLLGNYVNGHSQALGNTVCVSLSSLPKLAHTRCLVSEAAGFGSRSGGETALQLLVRQLGIPRPSFLQQLMKDLEMCRSAKDLECEVICKTLKDLAGQIRSFEQQLASPEIADSELPLALQPARIRSFLDLARPLVSEVEQQLQDLQDHAEKLRSWFAEVPATTFGTMMGNLAAVHEGLPPRHQQRSASSSRPRSCSPAPSRRRTSQLSDLQQQFASEAQVPDWMAAGSRRTVGTRASRSLSEQPSSTRRRLEPPESHRRARSLPASIDRELDFFRGSKDGSSKGLYSFKMKAYNGRGMMTPKRVTNGASGVAALALNRQASTAKLPPPASPRPRRGFEEGSSSMVASQESPAPHLPAPRTPRQRLNR